MTVYKAPTSAQLQDAVDASAALQAALTPLIEGTVSAPFLIDPAVTVPSAVAFKIIRITASHGGAQTMTATPQIAAGTQLGQEMKLIGVSDTAYITLTDAPIGSGLLLRGDMHLRNGRSVDLSWNGTVWVETGRN